MMKIEKHWIKEARHVASPNCNARPEQTEISLLVIHNISLPAGEFGGEYIEHLFTNCLDCYCHPDFADLEGLEVSAHVLIQRDGSLLQFVPFDQRAWHAGQSSYRGRENCNDYSIGIELEGSDTVPYTESQYQVLHSLTKALLAAYPGLQQEHIVGHSDIAPGRKTDPGPSFDWQYFRRQLAKPASGEIC